MDFQGVRPDLVQFEMRQTTGQPAWQPEMKRPGFFGRLLSGLGRLVGAVAAPLSFVFPPAALVSAGMYGAAGIGDQIQYKAYQRTLQNQAQMQQVSFPGLQPGGTLSPVSMQNQMVMDVLFARGDASLAMANAI